jgi:cytochrome c553
MPADARTGARWFGAAALLVCTLAGAQSAQPPEAQLQLCAACHGPQGVSQLPNAPSLAGQPKLFIENQLVLIREGLRDVPEMKGLLDALKDPELIALAQYFSAQKMPASPPAKDTAAFQRGQALAAKALCGTCHLPGYTGQQQVPRLAGQPEAFLAQSLKMFRDKPGMGRDTNMAAAVHGLKDNDVTDLAHFLAHFTPP